MKQLIYFELNKIIRRKATIAVTAGCLLLAALLFNLPALQHSADDADGNALSGRSAIAYQQEVSEEIGGSMDNVFIHSTLSQFQETAAKAENTPEDWSVYWEFAFPQSEYYTYFAPRTNLLQLLGQVYGDMATMSTMPLDPDSDFYAARTELLSEMLAGESGPNGTFHLTAQQQQYWLEKNAQISTPFTYGYRSGWDSLLQTAEIFTFLILAVCIGVAPVFAGEYQAGTDAVLLAARYGKNKLITGKLAASLLFATAVFLLGCLLCVGLPLLLFGGGGWDLPIQLSFFFSPRPLTYLQAALILLGVTYLVLLAFTALSLFLSARLKNAFSVLIVVFLLLFVPYFMSYSESSALYNLIFQLIPVNALKCSFQYTMLYSFGSLHLNIQTMTCLVYGVLFLLLLPLSRRTFRRHQSGS